MQNDNKEFQEFYEANIRQEALMVKKAKMAESSFAFFRGNTSQFFKDLAARQYNILEDNKLLCWVQGDAHLYNVGFFNKMRPDAKKIRFDMNDFDEAFIGSNLLDVIRFTVSITFFLEYLDRENEG